MELTELQSEVIIGAVYNLADRVITMMRDLEGEQKTLVEMRQKTEHEATKLKEALELLPESDRPGDAIGAIARVWPPPPAMKADPRIALGARFRHRDSGQIVTLVLMPTVREPRYMIESADGTGLLFVPVEKFDERFEFIAEAPVIGAKYMDAEKETIAVVTGFETLKVESGTKRFVTVRPCHWRKGDEDHTDHCYVDVDKFAEEYPTRIL